MNAMKISASAFFYAFKYTLIVSSFYAIYLFLDIYAPQGKEFFSYALAKVFTDIIIFLFPLLWIVFYFRNDSFDKSTLYNLLHRKNDDDIIDDAEDDLLDEKNDAECIESPIGYLSPKKHSDIKEIDKQQLLREYHAMLQEGILTQEEFNTIKKRHLKEMDTKK